MGGGGCRTIDMQDEHLSSQLESVLRTLVSVMLSGILGDPTTIESVRVRPFCRVLRLPGPV
jgi:hypothetical protein